MVTPNPDRSIPSWINKWLMINAGILIIDGSFCVLRPHSLPGGCLGSTVYYGYKWYIEADKHYADPKDSFIFSQGFGNLIEASICLLVLFNVFQTLSLKKMVTLIVSVMTCYKTVIFCIYSVDPGLGGRAYEGFVAEFLVFGLGSIWLIVPACVVWVLIQDFVEFKPRRSTSSNSFSTPKKPSVSNDKTGGNTLISRRITYSSKKSELADDIVDGNIPMSARSRRYNLRTRTDP